MAPYRNSHSRTGGARTTRTQIDHDVFEGLPVRHWRKKPISVTTIPDKENTNDMEARDLAWPELEMPRDSHLLSEMSQNLLRAARMPQAKKAAIAPITEDDKDTGEDEVADREIDIGFVAKRWAVVPKEQEGPEPEFLAKRRKGLPSIHSGATGTLSDTHRMRKTKIRKIDTSGVSSVLEVLVPEGQTVDGEIFEEETSPTQVPAPGTVIHGVGVANAEGLVITGDQGVSTSNRRRPPPSSNKRKAKSSGKSRRKKVAFAGPGDKPTSNGAIRLPSGTVQGGEYQVIEGEQGMTENDRTVHDESMLQDGDQEGDDGSEEGSEVDEGDEDREEGELSPSQSPSRSPLKPPPPVTVSTKIEVENTPPVELIPPSTPSSSTTTQTITVTEPSYTGFVPERTAEPTAEVPVKYTTGTGNETPMYITTEPTEPPANFNDQPTSEQVNENDHDNVDPMLLDDPVGNPKGEYVNTSIEQVVTQTVSTNMQTPETEAIPEITGQSLGELTGLPTAEPETLTETIASKSVAKFTEQGEEELSLEVTSVSPRATSAPFDANPPFEAPVASELKIESVPEIGTNNDADFTPDLAAVPMTESNPEDTVDIMEGPRTEATHDPIPTTPNEPAVETIGHVAAQPASVAPEEPAVDRTFKSFEISATPPNIQHPQSRTSKITEEYTAEPATEQLESRTSLHPPIPSPVPAEDDVIGPTEETKPEAVYEPVAPKASEYFPEPPAESAERRFSFTRPTASPKAPTPSPPTPIEDKFTLRAPYVSPKAPTMSPPTPIDRSIPSSPEVPPAGQQFELPPPLDPLQEGDPASAPSIQLIPEANRISVEAAPQVEPRINAQIPVEHDSLDGMAEPQVIDGSASISKANPSSAHFSDGEEDLLGSLERSLDQRRRGL